MRNVIKSVVKSTLTISVVGLFTLFGFQTAFGYGGGGGGGGGGSSVDYRSFDSESVYSGAQSLVPYRPSVVTGYFDDGQSLSLNIPEYTYDRPFSVMIVRGDEPLAIGGFAYVISFIDVETGVHIAELANDVSVRIAGLSLPDDRTAVSVRLYGSATGWVPFDGAVLDGEADSLTVTVRAMAKIAAFTVRVADLTGTETVADPSAFGAYSPAVAQTATMCINTDKGLIAVPGAALCQSGTLIKGSSVSTVYYCGRDGRRYVFPNERTYRSWYADFRGVTTISDGDLARIPLGGNVTYRPGLRLVKIQSDPRVYAVSRGGRLRWVSSEAIARTLYGDRWNRLVDDVPDSFFVNYRLGEPITGL